MKKNFLITIAAVICLVAFTTAVKAQSCVIRVWSYNLTTYYGNIYLYEYSPANQYLDMHEYSITPADATWNPTLHAYYYYKVEPLSDCQIPGNLYNATFYLKELLCVTKWDLRWATSGTFSFYDYYGSEPIVLPIIDLTAVPGGGGGDD